MTGKQRVMATVKLCERFINRMVLTAGMDNAEILQRGNRAEIRDPVLHLLEAGRGGGFVFGTNSRGSDISVESAEYALGLPAAYGNYPRGYDE